MARPHAQSSASTAAPALSSSAIEAKVEQLLAQVTLDEKLSLIGGVDGFYAPGLAKIGLPRMKMPDGPAGARNDGAATTMAGGPALAATWNEALAREVGLQIGRDARARGVHFMLGPGVNITSRRRTAATRVLSARIRSSPAEIAANYIQGMQSQGVTATVKHFLANNSEWERHDANVIVDERALREIYMPAFEAAVKQGTVGAIITTLYNLVQRAAHVAERPDRQRRAEEGMGLRRPRHVRLDGHLRRCCRGQRRAGPRDARTCVHEPAHAETGHRVGHAERRETIDDKVRRLLRTAIRFGWTEREQADRSIPLYNQHGRNAALQGAREGTVLLKNDGALLPIDATRVKTIAVIGPMAHPGAPVGGGSGGDRAVREHEPAQGPQRPARDERERDVSPRLPSLAQIAGATPFFTAAEGGRQGCRSSVSTARRCRARPRRRASSTA